MRYAVDSMLDFMDRRMEKAIRASAQHTGRRSFLAKLGTMVVGGAVLPLLPFERVSAAAAPAVTNEEDEAKCEYWAYCGIDGTLCNACAHMFSTCCLC